MLFRYQASVPFGDFWIRGIVRVSRSNRDLLSKGSWHFPLMMSHLGRGRQPLLSSPQPFLLPTVCVCVCVCICVCLPTLGKNLPASLFFFTSSCNSSSSSSPLLFHLPPPSPPPLPYFYSSLSSSPSSSFFSPLLLLLHPSFENTVSHFRFCLCCPGEQHSSRRPHGV